jgi:hypothetical protein
MELTGNQTMLLNTDDYSRVRDTVLNKLKEYVSKNTIEIEL